MESIFGWFGDIMGWVMGFFPHLLIIRTTHKGVKFVRGSKTVVLEPGLRWYWPLTTEVEIMAVTRQTINLKSQRLTTKDGVQVSVSVVVIYKITDILKSLVETWDYVETIGDSAQAAVVKIITTNDYEKLISEISTRVESALTARMRSKLGLHVERAAFTDFCRTISITTVTGD